MLVYFPEEALLFSLFFVYFSDQQFLFLTRECSLVIVFYLFLRNSTRKMYGWVDLLLLGQVVNEALSFLSSSSPCPITEFFLIQALPLHLELVQWHMVKVLLEILFLFVFFFYIFFFPRYTKHLFYRLLSSHSNKLSSV